VQPLENDPAVLFIRGSKASAAFEVEPVTTAAASQTEVVFEEQGGQYSLEKIRIAGESEGVDARPNRAVQLASSAGQSRERHVRATHHHRGREKQPESPAS
jgi:hypothetical protein